MPAGFLSEKQVAAYGRFEGELPPTEVERYFHLDDADRELIARRRSDVRRLGFGLQLGTVRAVGRFLDDPLDVPWAAVEYVAAQLEVADPSRVKRYVERPKTAREHGWEIRAEHGYRIFDERDVVEQFGRFLDGRAWTQSEGQVALCEHAVAWLRRNRILLPGVTVLERRVGSARREEDEAWLYREVTPQRGR